MEAIQLPLFYECGFRSACRNVWEVIKNVDTFRKSNISYTNYARAAYDQISYTRTKKLSCSLLKKKNKKKIIT